MKEKIKKKTEQRKREKSDDVTWTLGTKGVVPLLRHGLWISKINKENKSNTTKPKLHRGTQIKTTHLRRDLA